MFIIAAYHAVHLFPGVWFDFQLVDFAPHLFNSKYQKKILTST